MRVQATSIVTSTQPFYALVVTSGTIPNYNTTSNPGQDSNKWFVRVRAKLIGSPPAEVALEGFAVGIGNALASTSVGIINATSVALVALKSVEGDSTASEVTLDIDVENYEKGEIVMGYFLQQFLSNETDGGEDLAAAINSALSGVTTTGCICITLHAGGFDCTACVNGEPYSTLSGVTITEVRGAGLFIL